jgi:hypothetical protein
LDKPSLLQAAERIDNPGASQIERPRLRNRYVSALVARMHRPAVVECTLRACND